MFRPYIPDEARLPEMTFRALVLGTLLGMGEEILPGVYAAEVNYLRRKEWAVTAADILWRRSKLGLHLPAGAETRLDAWLTANA